MSPDYDAADGELPITEQYLFNNKGTVEAPVWSEKVELRLDPSLMNAVVKKHSCMSDTRFATTKQDLKTVDAGQVFICDDASHAGGTSGTLPIGKLLVEYDIEFSGPQAVTDNPETGGFSMRNSILTNDANAPFGDFSDVLMEAVPILTDVPTGASNDFGRFVRDWEGVITTKLENATGLSGTGRLFLGNERGNISNVNDTIVPLNPTFPLYGNVNGQIVSNYVTAKAGQYLKSQMPTFTSLTGASMQMFGGGSGYF